MQGESSRRGPPGEAVSALSPDACGPSTLWVLSLGSPRLLGSRKPTLTAPTHMAFLHTVPEFTALTGCGLFWSLGAKALQHLWRVLCGGSLPSYINRGKY